MKKWAWNWIIYYPYRFLRYGRTKDIETFYLEKVGEKIFLNYNSLYAPTFLGFSEERVVHYTKKEEIQPNETINIYIHTWNHLMNTKEKSYELKNNERIQVDIQTKIGDRKNAEKDHSINFPWRFDINW